MTSSISLLVKRGFPLVSKTAANPYAPVAKWILGTAGMVVGMIHVGGITRLTGSGLSMTTWSPLGTMPPLSETEWLVEFERYKTFPEWQQRQTMTLREFQYIYAWEYGHRMLGRTVGVVFVVPWLYFTAKRRIPKGYQPRMLSLLCLGGTQGLVGWWMVKSGLGNDRFGDKHEIRVKPIRLASHLTMAFATYGALVWTGLDLLSLPHQAELAQAARNIQKEALLHARKLRGGAMALTGLSAVTVVSGALVAGNDAGRAYNSFPKMNGEWIPSNILELQPLYKNFLENTATVQFNHRVLGMTTAATGLALLGMGKMHLVSPQVRQGLVAVGVATAGQVTLGVVTLLNYVPITLAAIHQLGSVVVFTSGLYLVHSLRYARPALLLARAASAATKSGASTNRAAKTAMAAAIPKVSKS